MSELKKQRLDIAASIFIKPCSEQELMERDLCKNKSLENIQRVILQLEKDAIYYRGEIMHINKKWAKENLKGYGFDFRSEKEKYIDSLTSFAKKIYDL